MANTISFGTAPVFDGTITSENTKYIGNNRFLRVVSQASPDATIAVVYEFQDVVNDTSPTILSEDVLVHNHTMTDIVLMELGNGDFVIHYDGDKLRTFHYDEVEGRCIDHDNLVEITPRSETLMGPVGQDSIVYITVFADSNGEEWDVVKVTFNNDRTTTTTVLEYIDRGTRDRGNLSTEWGSVVGTDTELFVADNSKRDAFWKPQYNSEQPAKYVSKIDTVDNSHVRMLTTSPEDFYYLAVGKINNDKILLFAKGDNDEWLFTMYGSQHQEMKQATFYPTIPHVSEESICDYVPIDEFYGLFFKATGAEVSFNIVNFVDSDQAFVADNSSTGNGIVVANTFNTNIIKYLPEGRIFASKVSDDTFCVQTDFTTFVCFKVVPS